MIIFLIPVSVPGVNIEECNKQFKQSAKQAGDDLKYNYFLSDLSTQQTRTQMQKKMESTIYDLMIKYYRETKDIVKRKQAKPVIKGLTHFQVRLNLKRALYSLITSSDYNKTIKRLQEAYLDLRSGQLPGGSAIQSERRENADLIAVLILKYLLNSSQRDKFLEFFRQHFFTFQTPLL